MLSERTSLSKLKQLIPRTLGSFQAQIKCCNILSAPTAGGSLALKSRAIIPYRHRSLQELIIDAANGVGAPKLAVASKRLSMLGLSIKLLNNGTAGGLNLNCGADFVQKEQACPTGFRSVIPGSRYASKDLAQNLHVTSA